VLVLVLVLAPLVLAPLVLVLVLAPLVLAPLVLVRRAFAGIYQRFANSGAVSLV